MTVPEQEPRPSVSTAPAEGASSGSTSPRASRGRGRLPAHLGPARTSTVLLAVAFLAIGVLYLFVKPPADARTTGAVTEPATTTAPPVVPLPGAPTTEQPTSAPEETPAPTTEAAPTPSEEPADPTVEEPEPFTPGDTTDPAPETSAPVPGTGAPSS